MFNHGIFNLPLDSVLSPYYSFTFRVDYVNIQNDDIACVSELIDMYCFNLLQ